MPPRANKCAFEPISKQRPVRQVRQTIMKCIVRKLVFDLPPVGNVPVNNYQSFNLTALISHGTSGRFKNPPRSIFVTHSVLKALASPGTARPLSGEQYLVAIRWMHLV